MPVADYADFNTAAEHARQISVQGVPLIPSPVLLASQSRTAIANGTSLQSPTLTVGQVGYELYVALDTAAVTAAGVSVDLKWSDSVYGVVTIADETWWVLPGTAAISHNVCIKGPSKGDTLNVTITNNTGATVNAGYAIITNSRVLTRDDGRTVQTVGALVANGFTSALYDLESNLVANANPVNVSIGGSTTRLLPLYSGQCAVHFETASGTSDMELAIALQADTSNAYVFTKIYDGFTDSHGNGYAIVNLPRSQCVMTLTNHNAAAKTLSVSIVAAEQVT